ncbi:MAG: ParB N-terminal domain-containing protein [Crenarchaeota archaeon]|nr:ParB N-terminal domain-containing protein [Thermoproteota archaeon]
MPPLRYEQMTIKEFLEKCKLPRIPTRPRKYYSIENIDKDLICSIKYIGVLTPILVDREYYIIDGVKRYIIIRTLTEKGENIPEPVPVLIKEDESFKEKPVSALHIAYIINKFRSEPRDEEFSDELITYVQDIAYKVWEIYNKDYEKASKHLGMSVETLRRLIEEYLKTLTT